MEPILEVRNLSIIHKKTKQRLVNNINFDLKKGGILGIIGESGSGKTLTCQCILNLLSREIFDVNGEVLFQNDNLISLTEENLNLRSEEHTSELQSRQY